MREAKQSLGSQEPPVAPRFLGGCHVGGRLFFMELCLWG